MKLIKLINEKVMIFSFFAMIIIAGGCLDSEGTAAWRLLAAIGTISIGSLIMYYWLEKEVE